MTVNVRDAAFRVLEQQGVDRIFANPGSTEVDLLADFPASMQFVLALHEGSVVGLATGFALAQGRPTVALLHTAAGLGNAVGAVATARVNRAPVVLLVGQQDRRHLASEPFLAGRIRGLAGDYPVSVREPVQAQDVPAAIARALHDAVALRGPSMVIVPMDDWFATVDETVPLAAPARLVRGSGIDESTVDLLVKEIEAAEAPIVVTGPLADGPDNWSALKMLTDRLGCPVLQEAHASRAGFDQTSPAFVGHLPGDRDALRRTVKGHDLVVVVGGVAFRQDRFATGGFVEDGTRVIVLTDDHDDAVISAADLAVVAPIASTVQAVAQRLTSRAPRHESTAHPQANNAHRDRLSPETVFDELARRLPAESTLVEETPSSRRILLDRVPVRRPLGFLTAAMGGLGFGLAAATGVKMAQPQRPVVAVVGDGAALYNVHALWSAHRYDVGVLFIVMANGRYAVMDRLSHMAGAQPIWPDFEDVDVATLARGQGCEARTVEDLAGLTAALDDVVPTLATRTTPLLLNVEVSS